MIIFTVYSIVVSIEGRRVPFDHVAPGPWIVKEGVSDGFGVRCGKWLTYDDCIVVRKSRSGDTHVEVWTDGPIIIDRMSCAIDDLEEMSAEHLPRLSSPSIIP